ncbi:hypothetical protein P5X63_18295, partial [Microbacterium sp. RD02]|uniref:hypothetical protein n=2 Tax=Microbacterium TaxID=33882 RepID=UPI002468601D
RRKCPLGTWPAQPESTALYGMALMDDRIERLWQKAEDAIDRNDTDQAEEYRVLAGHIAWHRRKEARELNRTLEHVREAD